jgi:LPPG:FO 2-phospho-L-lactate transferase
MKGAVVLLAGGLGGARLAPRLGAILGPGRLSVVANVGDDFHWHELLICPDIDTICYALAGVFDFERGWGRLADTWTFAEEERRRGISHWAKVGDADVALAMQRTELLGSGMSLGQVTTLLAERIGVTDVEVMPASDEPAPTMLELAGKDSPSSPRPANASGGVASVRSNGDKEGSFVGYAEWFVRLDAAAPLVRLLRPQARASAKALDRVRSASAVVLAPSNPLASIGAILALEGMPEALASVERRIGILAFSGREPPTDEALARRLRAQAALLGTIGRGSRPSDHAVVLAPLVTDLVVDECDLEEVAEVLRPPRRTTGDCAELAPVRLHPGSLLDDGALASLVADLVTGRTG